ncbi:MAG: cold-shock protein [Bradyrhizobium sp.]|uniref:cold-shock protein n=1 Tax=Bradyrhizobium sp. TaxID=376 RepID=UPI0025B97843|nr:cold-shock protein [Bradyrhizobium sp.]MBI5263590.1 cold-shock protein [Bradyrhizobium sp.]
MATGFVVWFNKFKGYGFIRPDGGGRDVFVHASAVQRAGLAELVEGQRISYDVVSSSGTADNLRVAGRTRADRNNHEADRR